MKIEGNTVTFKSLDYNWKAEEAGLKQCTVRIMNGDEWHDFMQFSYDYAVMVLRPAQMPKKDRKNIRIVNADYPDHVFEREISHVSVIGDLLYNFLILICWNHRGIEEDLPWIYNGECINDGKYVCNIGYACDGCPYNKDERIVPTNIPPFG